MPVYTYQCDECGVRFEAKQHFSDAPISVCPECGGATHKVIGPVGVVFKGSGFYVNDSRSNNSALGKPRKDADSGTASEAKTTDSKPAETKATGSSDN
jgi:putative FmdB family regulatory protein